MVLNKNPIVFVFFSCKLVSYYRPLSLDWDELWDFVGDGENTTKVSLNVTGNARPLPRTELTAPPSTFILLEE